MDGSPELQAKHNNGRASRPKHKKQSEAEM